MKKKPEEQLTTRRAVEAFFKMFRPRTYMHWDTPEIDDELKKMRQEFEKQPAVVKLEKRREAILAKRRVERLQIQQDLNRVQRHYLAKGLTPQVLKMIADLADKYADSSTTEE